VRAREAAELLLRCERGVEHEVGRPLPELLGRRDGAAGGVAPDAADCEPLERERLTTKLTTRGDGEEKAPQQKSLQGLLFTQSGRRDLNPRPPEPHATR
jgi:hypothetical protein